MQYHRENVMLYRSLAAINRHEWMLKLCTCTHNIIRYILGLNIHTCTCSDLPSIHKACRPNKPSVQYRLSSMWEWEECNSFDVASGSTQISPSSRALKSAWGERWHVYVPCLVPTRWAQSDLCQVLLPLSSHWGLSYRHSSSSYHYYLCHHYDLDQI